MFSQDNSEVHRVSTNGRSLSEAHAHDGPRSNLVAAFPSILSRGSFQVLVQRYTFTSLDSCLPSLNFPEFGRPRRFAVSRT